MLTSFQLTAIMKNSNGTPLLRIPMHQALQTTLMASWHEQYEAFKGNISEVDFAPGYNPEGDERFRLSAFELPDWLANEDITTISNLNSISQHEDNFELIRAIAAFVRIDNHELLLFQNFTRSHVIRPIRSIFLMNGNYNTRTRPGLTLDNKLAAVYFVQDSKLLFRSFRTTNTFLPLDDFYREASESEIRSILQHERLAPENTNDIAAFGRTQWFRKRFAMLRDSGILDDYSAQAIQGHSQNYDVNIQLNGDSIVFPAEKPEAKRLLQFLNEEIFKGAITDTLYETNSKREANSD
ncbi:MAG: hypothetical protein U5N86_05740 [Planctomycetota bacterium]|nr:hypothetical protein [Planctomycetota bacterium]